MPSYENLVSENILYLPILQKRLHVNPTTVSLSRKKVHIPIDDTVVNVWLKGPESKSIEALGNAMATLALAFCQMINNGQGKTSVSQKTSPSDLVTEMDRGIEMLIRLWLNRFFPDHKIIGEEGPKPQVAPDSVIWYLDPIDGTTNYVEGRKNVSLHIGSTHLGKPFINLVGLPFENTVFLRIGQEKQVWVITPTSKKILDPPTPPPKPIFGTEYMDSRQTEAKHFAALTRKHNASPLRVKSIGVNILQLLLGRSSLFFKPKAKPWDYMAPFGLLDAYSDHIALSLIPLDSKTPISPFSNDPAFLDFVNRKLKTNSRLGFVQAEFKTYK
ncbi:MAG: inositol monophosphatase family protein [Candidatus Margulisiibacteriota bacterium]